MLKKYQYGGQHHTMVVLEKGQPKVKVEPNEVIETEMDLPKQLFKTIEATLKAKTKKQVQKEESNEESKEEVEVKEESNEESKEWEATTETEEN